MAPIACRMQDGRRLGDVLAHDREVADLLVALAELVVSKADRPGIVCRLGVLQGTDVVRDGARLIAAGERDSAVQPPQDREV